MDFALPFLQAACFFEASEMIKRLACAHFYLSLEKNISAAFSRSAVKFIRIKKYSRATVGRYYYFLIIIAGTKGKNEKLIFCLTD